MSSVEIPADPWEIREIPAGDPTRYRGALTRCRKILRGETRVFVTLFSLSTSLLPLGAQRPLCLRGPPQAGSYRLAPLYPRSPVADMCHHRGAVCAPAGLVFRCEKDTWRGADAIRSWRGDGVLGVLLGAPCWDALDAPARGAPRGVVVGISRGVRARGTRDVARGVPRGVALGVTLGIGGGHVLTSGARFGRGDRTTYMCVGAPWSTCGLSSGSRGSIAR